MSTSPTAAGHLPHPQGSGVLREITHHWRIVLLVTLAALAAGVVAVALEGPSYTAEKGLIVTPLPQEDQTFLSTSLIRETGDTARTASTTADSLPADAINVETARRLGGGWTADSVDQAVELEPAATGNVIDIAAHASTPERAALLADAFVDSTLSVRWQTIAEELDRRISGFDRVADSSGLKHDRGILVATRLGGRDPTLSAGGRNATVSADGASTQGVLMLALTGGLVLGALTAVAVSRFAPRPRGEGALPGANVRSPGGDRELPNPAP